jgi:hypothetical protein
MVVGRVSTCGSPGVEILWSITEPSVKNRGKAVWLNSGETLGAAGRYQSQLATGVGEQTLES